MKRSHNNLCRQTTSNRQLPPIFLSDSHQLFNQSGGDADQPRYCEDVDAARQSKKTIDLSLRKENLCDKGFIEVSTQHIQTEEKSFQCKQCKKSFGHPGHLKLVHAVERPCVCKHGDMAFSELGHLKRHQSVSAEKPFSCTQCDKAFSELGPLKRHQRVHTGGKPYSCTQCDKAFSQLCNLKTHQSVHTG